MYGIIVRIQRFSIQDGPGIRTTVFLKGCALRCSWCANPESQNVDVELQYERTKCVVDCCECIRMCKNEAVSKHGGQISIDRSKCAVCGKCAQSCYRRALTVVGEKVSVEEVVNEVERDEPFYERSGGGVTFSGGEPLCQPEFVKEIAKACKYKGISTTLDTSGYANWKILKDVLRYIDLVLYDIKHLSPGEHKKFTGVDNYLILENARKLSKESIPLILRIPVIPGVNDTYENLRELAKFAKNLDHLSGGVELLPYHRIGASKYPALGKRYSMARLRQPTKEHMHKVKELLESFGLEPLIVS